MKSSLRPSSLGFLVLALLLFVSSAAGQAVSASMLGTVTDSSGAVVAGAKVTVTEIGTQTIRTGRSNESGNYNFQDLPPGNYVVTAEMTGFKKESRKDILLQVNSSQRVDLQLQPGNVTETVEVTGAPPQLQTDRADTGRKLDTMVVAELPVLSSNRNYQVLLNLVPGTAPATEQHSQFFNASDSLQTEVNGGARVANSYMIEGIDDNERTGLLQVLIPPIEAIQTVDVSTSNHSVDLGRGAGAITNVILKSGTNQWHGSGYEFFQNSNLDARNFFNPTVAPLHYNYFGGTIGGPIKRNKLFFFADYLKTWDHEANASLVTVPSALSRTGNLSENAAQVYDPMTGNAAGVGRTKFPNNVIPSGRIDPIAMKILALVPLPNQPFNPAQPSNNYFDTLPFTKDTQFTDGKIDYNITDKDRLAGRFSFQRPVVFQAPLFGAAGGPGPGGAFMGTGIQKTYSTGINWTHIFSPTLLNEFRFGIAHYHNEAQNSDYGTNASQAIGIPNINISGFTSGLVGVNGPFSNPMVGYSASLPWDRAEANIDVVDNVTKTYRNHTVTVGFDIRRVRDDLLQTQSFSPRGIFAFGSSQTGCAGTCLLANGTTTSPTTQDPTTAWNNTMGSLLLDLPNTGTGRDFSITFPTYRAWQIFAYAGDKWQVSNKLTVDLGLRWEAYPPAVARFPGSFSNFNPANNTLVVAGVGGNPDNLGMTNHLNYWAPRLGISYRLNDKTVIRVGFGSSYTPFGDNRYAWDNYPVKGNVGTVSNPTGGAFAPALLPSGAPVTFQTGIPAPAPVPVPSNGVYSIAALGFNGSTFNYIPLDFKNPYVETWNFTIQRALPYHFALDLAYVGNHGVDISSGRNLNASPVIAATSALGQTFQPEYPRTGTTNYYYQGFSSMYNALQAKIDRRFQNGLGITTSFTWGRGMGYAIGSDDNGFFGFYQAGQGRRNYLRNNFDRKYTFVQSYVYELPFGKGKHFLNSANNVANAVIGGWKIQGVMTIMTGTPVNISYSSTYLNEPGTANTAQQVVSSVNILHGINTVSNGGSPWFDPTAFAAPPCQSSTPSAACPNGQVVGNVGGNTLTGPGFFSVNLALAKDTRITERIGMQLRLETNNTTNTAQFSNPNGGCCTSNNANFGFVTGTVGSGTGQVNGTGGGRTVQLGLKLTF